MPIAKLPPLLVNQIAAGEVIDRPCAVVKELLDNAIDAGATRLRIDIEEGGSQLIRVRDDGHGVPPEELPLAVAAHATSKLQTADDLAAIATLGFRGEALASIASVSRLRLSSLATTDGARAAEGAAIEQAGDDVSLVSPAALAPGSVVEVRDLFFNTPARRKFLRAASTEFGHIADTVQRLAMTHPHLGFTLTHNERTTLDLPPNQSRRARCVALLGKELDDALMETCHVDGPEQGGAEVWALLGRPEIARATAKFQYLTVNGRPVRDRNLAHAVREAYRGLIPPDRQPVAVVQINLDPAAVDVNVHPTKAEVRFREPSRLHGLVLHTLRRCLLANDLTPEVKWRMADGGSRMDAAAGAQPVADGLSPLLTPAQPSTIEDPTSAIRPDAFVDYFKRMDPTQKGFVYEEVRREMHDTASGPPDADASNAPAAAASAASPHSAHNPTTILQVHNSYVITQDEQGVLIVDQHALHERIMFEKLRHRILEQGRPLESQRLLVPATVPADAQRQALLDDLSPLLHALGVEAAPMGPATAAVHAFPSLLLGRKVDPVAFLSDLLDQAQQGNIDPDTLVEPKHTPLGPPASAGGDPNDEPDPIAHLNPTALEAALHEVLDMMSCKAAIRAGDKLTDAELTELLARREQLERGSNCPHGRPTTLRLTLKDLERQFGRS